MLGEPRSHRHCNRGHVMAQQRRGWGKDAWSKTARGLEGVPQDPEPFAAAATPFCWPPLSPFAAVAACLRFADS